MILELPQNNQGLGEGGGLGCRWDRVSCELIIVDPEYWIREVHHIILITFVYV